MDGKKKKEIAIEVVFFAALVAVTFLVAAIGSRKDLIVGAIGFALCGVVMIVMALCYQKSGKKISSRCSQKAEGTVVEVWEGMDRIPGGDGRHKVLMWYIKYTFSTGKMTVTGKTPETVGNLPFLQGQKVHVCYNPENPYDCVLEEQQTETSYRIWLILGMEILIAAVLAVVLACFL